MVDLFSRFIILKSFPINKLLLLSNSLLISSVLSAGLGSLLAIMEKSLLLPSLLNLLFAKKTTVKQLQGRKEDWDLYVPATQHAMNLKYSRLHKSRSYTVTFNEVLNDMKDHSHIKPTLRSEAIDSKLIENKFNYATEIVVSALAKRIKETQDVDNAYFIKTSNYTTQRNSR
jgi:hypothetical protein